MAASTLLSSIINSVDRGTEKYILDQLDVVDAALSEEIKRKMFVFEDIVKLSDQAVRIVLQNVDQSDITIAIKGANEDVKEVIMRNLSKRVQEMIKEELEIMGPARKEGRRRRTAEDCKYYKKP